MTQDRLNSGRDRCGTHPIGMSDAVASPLLGTATGTGRPDEPAHHALQSNVRIYDPNAVRRSHNYGDHQPLYLDFYECRRG
jgi:hypothetical protein